MASSRKSASTLIWSMVIVSFLVLLTATVLQVLYGTGQTALISKPVDSIVFELAKQASTALLAAGTIGFAIQTVMAKYSDEEERGVQVFRREGLENVFTNYNDPAYQAVLIKLIQSARSEIIFIGLGHGILVNHTNLLDELRTILLKRSIAITLLFADEELSGVKSRVSEEAAAHHSLGLGYDQTWVHRFPEEVRTHVSSQISDPAKLRLRCGYLKFVPFLHYIRIDDSMFFSPYGSPEQRGSASPVLHFRRTEKGHCEAFLMDFEREAMRDFRPMN